MDLNKFLWSHTKADILKYLTFRRQWVSMRALEQDLTWTFPAIKKQIDSLEKNCVVVVEKTSLKRSIEIAPPIKFMLTQFLIASLQHDVQTLLYSYTTIISKIYRWKLFDKSIDPDIVIIYHPIDEQYIMQIKNELNIVFESYFVMAVLAVFMSTTDFEKRQRYADKFVLELMRIDVK